MTDISDYLQNQYYISGTCSRNIFTVDHVTSLHILSSGGVIFDLNLRRLLPFKWLLDDCNQNVLLMTVLSFQFCCWLWLCVYSGPRVIWMWRQRSWQRSCPSTRCLTGASGWLLGLPAWPWSPASCTSVWGGAMKLFEKTFAFENVYMCMGICEQFKN